MVGTPCDVAIRRVPQSAGYAGAGGLQTASVFAGPLACRMPYLIALSSVGVDSVTPRGDRCERRPSRSPLEMGTLGGLPVARLTAARGDGGDRKREIRGARPRCVQRSGDAG